MTSPPTEQQCLAMPRQSYARNPSQPDLSSEEEKKSSLGTGRANRVEFALWLRRRDRDGVGGRGGQRLGNVRSWSDV